LQYEVRFFAIISVCSIRTYDLLRIHERLVVENIRQKFTIHRLNVFTTQNLTEQTDNLKQ